MNQWVKFTKKNLKESSMILLLFRNWTIYRATVIQDKGEFQLTLAYPCPSVSYTFKALKQQGVIAFHEFPDIEGFLKLLEDK